MKSIGRLLLDTFLSLQESDLEVIDEEEEEDYSQYVEDGVSEDEAEPEYVDDIAPSKEDSISITQVNKFKEGRRHQGSLNQINESNSNSCDEEEEEELNFPSGSTKRVINLASGNLINQLFLESIIEIY